MTDNGAMEDMRIELALPREEHYEGQSESAREEKSGKKAARKQILLRLDPSKYFSALIRPCTPPSPNGPQTIFVR